MSDELDAYDLHMLAAAAKRTRVRVKRADGEWVGGTLIRWYPKTTKHDGKALVVTQVPQAYVCLEANE